MKVFSEKERRTFEQICSMRQNQVISMMRQILRKKYEKVISTPAYIVAIGDIPVGLVAHADTVFKLPPMDFFYDTEKNVFWSPDGLGADDRAGIFAILQILAAGYRPHVIITTDEEKGCIGATKLASNIKEFPAELKCLIQLDRRGHLDSVFYDCDNFEFEDYINRHGFKTALGTYSDISVLGPAWEVSAVNLSVGYVDEHFETEHLYVNSLFETINKVKSILDDIKDEEKFPYIETPSLAAYGYAWDDGYNLHYVHPMSEWKAPGEDEAACQFCGKIHPREEMIPLTWYAASTRDMEFYVCNNCFSKYLKNIEWCSVCNTGYFIGENDRKNMPTDTKNWKCKHCVAEEKINDSVAPGNTDEV